MHRDTFKSTSVALALPTPPKLHPASALQTQGEAFSFQYQGVLGHLSHFWDSEDSLGLL